MRLLLFLLIALSTTPAFAKDRAESFEYEVSWGYSDVADVSLQRGCTRDGYRPAKLSARSEGVAEQLHPFLIKLDSFAAPDGRVLEGRTAITEEGVARRYRTRFARDGAAETHKTFRNKDGKLKLKLRPGTHDLLSWIFALREENLAFGSAFSYFVWDGWKLTRVTAHVGKLEHVWTPQGTFDAYRVTLRRVRLHHAGKAQYQPKSDDEKLGTVWLRNDAARTPVAMNFNAPVGMAKLRLSRSTTKACQ